MHHCTYRDTEFSLLFPHLLVSFCGSLTHLGTTYRAARGLGQLGVRQNTSDILLLGKWNSYSVSHLLGNHLFRVPEILSFCNSIWDGPCWIPIGIQLDDTPLVLYYHWGFALRNSEVMRWKCYHDLEVWVLSLASGEDFDVDTTLYCILWRTEIWLFKYLLKLVKI